MSLFLIFRYNFFRVFYWIHFFFSIFMRLLISWIFLPSDVIMLSKYGNLLTGWSLWLSRYMFWSFFYLPKFNDPTFFTAIFSNLPGLYYEWSLKTKIIIRLRITIYYKRWLLIVKHELLLQISLYYYLYYLLYYSFVIHLHLRQNEKVYDWTYMTSKI